MKLFVTVVLYTLGVATAYSDFDDSVDIQAVVDDANQLKAFIDCFFDAGPCVDYMIVAKKHISEVIMDACRECDDIQRHDMKIFLEGVEEKFPDELVKFKNKYDKDGTLIPRIKEVLQKY